MRACERNQSTKLGLPLRGECDVEAHACVVVGTLAPQGELQAHATTSGSTYEGVRCSLILYVSCATKSSAVTRT